MDVRLAWLGGIIDGEGMITVIRRTKSARPGYIPRISIVNTDERIIAEVSDILHQLALPHYVQTKAGKGTWKTKWEVLFNGYLRCNDALPWIIPNLIAKREKAEALYELCGRRLSHGPNVRYCDVDYELVARIRGVQE